MIEYIIGIVSGFITGGVIILLRSNKKLKSKIKTLTDENSILKQLSDTLIAEKENWQFRNKPIPRKKRENK